VVATRVETFGGTTPGIVRSGRCRVPGREAAQQSPGPGMQPTRRARAMEVLTSVEVAVHPPHQPVEHVYNSNESSMQAWNRIKRPATTDCTPREAIPK
jgi:hypothetical protein